MIYFIKDEYTVDMHERTAPKCPAVLDHLADPVAVIDFIGMGVFNDRYGTTFEAGERILPIEKTVFEDRRQGDAVLRFGILLHPYVVDGHLLGEFGGMIRAARPVAADRDVEQEMESLFKGCRETVSLRKPVGFRVVVHIIDIPADLPMFPLNGKSVEIVAEVA